MHVWCLQTRRSELLPHLRRSIRAKLNYVNQTGPLPGNDTNCPNFKRPVTAKLTDLTKPSLDCLRTWYDILRAYGPHHEHWSNLHRFVVSSIGSPAAGC